MIIVVYFSGKAVGSNPSMPVTSITDVINLMAIIREEGLLKYELCRVYAHFAFEHAMNTKSTSVLLTSCILN